jgi:hypothetical protein
MPVNNLDPITDIPAGLLRVGKGPDLAVFHAHTHLICRCCAGALFDFVSSVAAAYCASYRGKLAAVAGADLIAEYAAQKSTGHHADPARLRCMLDGLYRLDTATAMADRRRLRDGL